MIYVIGWMWLNVYASFKSTSSQTQKKITLGTLISNEHITPENYHKTVFFCWLLWVAQMIAEIL